MKKKRVVDVIEELLTPYVKTLEMEIVDVEFVKEGPYRYLRITIDKETPVTLDDCQLVSQYLNSKIDSIDPIEEQYFLEVTSPGVERVLKKDKEYEKYAGRTVLVKLFQPYEGQKALTGTLVGLVDDHIVIDSDHMGRVDLPKSKVSVTKLVADFEQEG